MRHHKISSRFAAALLLWNIGCASTPATTSPEDSATDREEEFVNSGELCLQFPVLAQQAQASIIPGVSIDPEPMRQMIDQQRLRFQCCYEHLVERSSVSRSDLEIQIKIAFNSRTGDITDVSADPKPEYVDDPLLDEKFITCSEMIAWQMEVPDSLILSPIAEGAEDQHAEQPSTPYEPGSALPPAHNDSPARETIIFTYPLYFWP